MTKIILAFETSCDDTSIALFKNENLIFMDTASQIKVHNKTGGVVPEIAAREHANIIFKVLDNVLIKSKIKLKDITHIGVTVSPGLIPSLLTGITVANTLSLILKIPLIEINHIKAHIFSNFLDRKKDNINYPLVCLTVSGGHNEIYYMENMWNMTKIGGTTDDSAGEAFDKVSKMMGEQYPGGPIISKLAKEYEKENINNDSKINSEGQSNDNKIKTNLFPRVWLKKDEFDFSFSGLKSSVKREIDKRIKLNGKLSKKDKEEISFEFENSVVEVLAYKLINAGIKKGVKTIMLSGGVSANNKLKEIIDTLAKKNKLKFIYPKKIKYSMDNAAMVGINTYYKIKEDNL